MMLSRYPCIQIAENTWEINEFDCASLFLLAGQDSALLIDTGIGIGALDAFVKTLTPLPLKVLLTHNHRDHVGNAPCFEAVHISSIDLRMGRMLRPLTTLESRLAYACHVRDAHAGMAYPWTRNDMQAFSAEPEVICIEPQHTFDLGGRTVTCYHTPGHTPGSFSAIDSQTGFLFCGDACNGTIGLGVRPIEGMRHATMEEALMGLRSLDGRADPGRVYSGHSDCRGFGKPLGRDVLRHAMEAMALVIAGDYVAEHTHIKSIGADVETMTYKGVKLQFHSGNVRGGV